MHVDVCCCVLLYVELSLSRSCVSKSCEVLHPLMFALYLVIVLGMLVCMSLLTSLCIFIVSNDVLQRLCVLVVGLVEGCCNRVVYVV